MWLHVPGEREPATLAHPFSIWMLVGGKPECVQSGDVDWRKTPWTHVLDLWSNDESKARRLAAHLAQPRPRMTVLSLCSGYGGIDLALESAMGTETICYVERQLYAAAVLAERQRTEDLAPAPIWDSLETFDCAPWRGRVDIVCAGWPCQGASLAGKRKGVDDERWLWPEVWRIVQEVGADYFFFENVPGLLSVNRGEAFAEVVRDLDAGGFVGTWDCVPAAAVGAPHVRDRLFCLAAHADRLKLRVESERDQRSWGGRTNDPALGQRV